MKKTAAIRTRLAPDTKEKFIHACGGYRNISKGLREAIALYIASKSRQSPDEKAEALAASITSTSS